MCSLKPQHTSILPYIFNREDICFHFSAVIKCTSYSVDSHTFVLHTCWEQTHMDLFKVYVSCLFLIIQITCITPASVHNKFILCEEKLCH